MKLNISRGTPGLRLIPCPVQFLHKLSPGKPRSPASFLCYWYVSIHNRSQIMLCSQKAATWPHFNGVVVWALEHKIKEDRTWAMCLPHRRKLVETRLTDRTSRLW